MAGYSDVVQLPTGRVEALIFQTECPLSRPVQVPRYGRHGRIADTQPALLDNRFGSEPAISDWVLPLVHCRIGNSINSAPVCTCGSSAALMQNPVYSEPRPILRKDTPCTRVIASLNRLALVGFSP